MLKAKIVMTGKVVSLLIPLSLAASATRIWAHPDPAELGPRVVNPLNHHQYVLLGPGTWRDSEQKAVAMGGHLATIRNAQEENWIFQTFGSYGGIQRLLWIGLTDREKKFHFTWSSGESVSYTCWAPGEPNNAGHGEDFVAIYYPNHDQHNRWNDWADRESDPIGLPMCGVVEIIPPDVSGVSPSTPGSMSHGIALAGTQFIDIRPALIITNESGRIRLQWPLAMAHYTLEATTNLGAGFSMFGYSELTNNVSGMVYVTISNPVPRMFFRLKQP